MNSTSYNRHLFYMRNYIHHSDKSYLSQYIQNNSVSEHKVLKDHYKFIRDEASDSKDPRWEIRMSVKYYNKLFKEYALADLSRYSEGKVGLRWRTEKEIVIGKGQFICGNKHCNSENDLHSYELLFAYEENRERKKCLVKVRVCSECAVKLFYKKIASIKERNYRKGKKRRKKNHVDKDSQHSEALSFLKESGSSIHKSIEDIQGELNVDEKQIERSTNSDNNEPFDDLLL